MTERKKTYEISGLGFDIIGQGTTNTAGHCSVSKGKIKFSKNIFRNYAEEDIEELSRRIDKALKIICYGE